MDPTHSGSYKEYRAYSRESMNLRTAIALPSLPRICVARHSRPTTRNLYTSPPWIVSGPPGATTMSPTPKFHPAQAYRWPSMPGPNPAHMIPAVSSAT